LCQLSIICFRAAFKYVNHTLVGTAVEGGGMGRGFRSKRACAWASTISTRSSEAIRDQNSSIQQRSRSEEASFQRDMGKPRGLEGDIAGLRKMRRERGRVERRSGRVGDEDKCKRERREPGGE
jgi:hypothetical protein